MSRSARQLESITARDTVATRLGTLQFRIGPPAVDTVPAPAPHPLLDDLESTCGSPRSASATNRRLRGSQDSPNRSFGQREALIP
jgi:hypothetical protein